MINSMANPFGRNLPIYHLSARQRKNLRPRRDRLLKGDRLVVLVVRREIRNGVGCRPLLRVPCLVGQDHGQEARGALDPHPDVERAAALPVLRPGPELTQAQVFLGLRNRRAPDAGEDEFVPELVELGELFVFPRSLTS